MTIVYKCDNCEKISYDRKELNDWFFLHAEEKDFCPECIELFRAVVKEYDKKHDDGKNSEPFPAYRVG